MPVSVYIRFVTSCLEKIKQKQRKNYTYILSEVEGKNKNTLSQGIIYNT